MRDEGQEPQGDPQAMSVAPAPYLPFMDPHKGKAPGLWALDPAEWIEIDAAYAPQMAYRDRLIAGKGAVVADAAAEGGPAVAELRAALEAHLLARFPDRFARVEGGLRRGDGVVIGQDGVRDLGRLVQEDLLLLVAGDEGEEHRLVAGALCFPSRWRLQDKLGKPLTPIHAPVPDYAEALAKRVNRVFAALHAERPVQRLNWSVIETPELHLLAEESAREKKERDLSGPFYLRVERQTLRRLPETGATVFGVKTYVTPLADLPQEARAELRRRIAAMTAAEAAYKGGERWREAALARLA